VSCVARVWSEILPRPADDEGSDPPYDRSFKPALCRAAIVGIDLSEAMLASARERLPTFQFAVGHIAAWVPEVPPDLVFANASLHWVPGHEALIPTLLSALAPGGVLAVQMPDNLDEPSHVLKRETAADSRFVASIGDSEKQRARILPAGRYYACCRRRPRWTSGGRRTTTSWTPPVTRRMAASDRAQGVPRSPDAGTS
jgi:SAM-dependent methyltransferase